VAGSNDSGDSSSDGEQPRDRASGGGTASDRKRDPRLAMFARGGRDDRAKPNAWQAMVIADVTGPDGDCPDATDDELVGLLRGWASLDSWVYAGKLKVVRALLRRRPNPGRCVGYTESGLPQVWDARLAREISLQLGISSVAADRLILVAWSLDARLPRIGQALDDGLLDPGRVNMIVHETRVVPDDPAMLSRVQEIILAGLPKCRTWSALQRLVQQAVCTVDPEGARKRREQAEREHARIRFWREAEGTCALLGEGLPTDQALAANASIEARAQAYRAAGVKERADILRVAGYLDLLNGVSIAARVAWFEESARARDGESSTVGGSDARGSGGSSANCTSDDQDAPDNPDAPDGHDEPASDAVTGKPHADGYPWTEPPADGYPVGEDSSDDWVPDELRCDSCGLDDCRCGGAVNVGSANVGSGSTSDPDPYLAPNPNPALAANVNLTVPLTTVMGLAWRPGEARGLGALDPDLARKLAEAAARNPHSKFCVTILDDERHAIAHGCGKPIRIRPRKSSRSGKPGKSPRGQRDGPPPPGRTASTVSTTFTPSGKPGPPGGLGSWILTLPGARTPFLVEVHAVPTGDCDEHRYSSAGHDPSGLLRHLVQVRDGKCGFPTCGRHAKESDFEHARPYEKGGRTCGCNCYSCSRSCHRLKQSAGWTVTEVRPGYHQWKTPTGRVYVQEPWQYPA
jgi:Domain of unknown function (DUF222)